MKKSLISATMVASLAILAVLSGCGGGGSSSDVPPQQMPAVVVVTPAPAASAPTVTIQSVAKVTLTTSVVSTGTDIGSVSDLKASDVADGVVTDKAVWTVSVIGGTPTGALTVSSTGKVLAGGKPLVVPVGSTWTISGTATLGGKTVDFSFIVTGKCTDGLTANGAGCTVAGMSDAKLFYVGLDYSADGSVISDRTFYTIDIDGGEHKLSLYKKMGAITQFCGLSVKLGTHGGRLISCNGILGHESDTGTYEVGPDYLAKVDNVDRRNEADYQRAKTSNWSFIGVDTPQVCRVVPGLGTCYAPLHDVIAGLAATVTN